MKTIFRFFASVLVGSILNSCGPVLYSNVGQNVPLLQEKGEFSGQFSYSASSGAWSADGIGLQGAYAISEKVGIISSFSSLWGTDESQDYEWEGNGTYFELGAGLFGGKQENKFLYEAFAGIGSGSIRNTSLVNRGEFFNVKYLKPFIQPSVAFSTKYFEMALTPRIAYISYTSQDDFQFGQNPEQIDPREYFDKNHNTMVFEPGIMIRGGFPGAKLELQYSYSTLKEPLEEYFVINSDYFSIGLRFIIAGRTASKE